MVLLAACGPLQVSMTKVGQKDQSLARSYMNYAGCKRKFNVSSFEHRWKMRFNQAKMEAKAKAKAASSSSSSSDSK